MQNLLVSLIVRGYCRIKSNDMNIIDGIILIIFEYHRSATWSNTYKGDNIKLFDDDSRALRVDDDGDHSVRADFCIERGKIISWELDCYIVIRHCNFIGVVSSKTLDFNASPKDGMTDAYGIDDGDEELYVGKTEPVLITFNRPEFPLQEVFKIKVVANWIEKQCKLTFYYKDEKINDKNDDYTILLPELDDMIVWYPCVTPFNKDAYFIIRYA